MTDYPLIPIFGKNVAITHGFQYLLINWKKSYHNQSDVFLIRIGYFYFKLCGIIGYDHFKLSFYNLNYIFDRHSFLSNISRLILRQYGINPLDRGGSLLE